VKTYNMYVKFNGEEHMMKVTCDSDNIDEVISFFKMHFDVDDFELIKYEETIVNIKIDINQWN